ncbi:MAG: hypothetical protein SVY10_14250 [Thermodesulfobacteriota bacterium]|nr:hypothetical protein [Thermodesulfobacteriota bacterium]
MKKNIVIMALLFTLSVCATAWTSDLTIPHRFSAGSTAVASHVNENFSAIENAVDDNDMRISANADEIANLTSVVGNLELVRTISFPGAALSFDPTYTHIEPHKNGLLWGIAYSAGASILVKAPYDYAGGDVTFCIFFQPTTSSAGLIQFFLKPTSYNSGDGQIDPGILSGDPVNVGGISGSGTVYEQTFVIPADRLTKDWWYTAIQRQDLQSTYNDEVIVFGVAYEYLAVR